MISLPVERIATAAARRPRRRARRSPRVAPTRLGFSSCPAPRIVCPAAMSAARRPMCWRGYTGVSIRTSIVGSSRFLRPSRPRPRRAASARRWRSPCIRRASTRACAVSAGEDRVDAAERRWFAAAGAEGVCGDHRVAVHRRAIEGRHVRPATSRPREHAAVGVASSGTRSVRAIGTRSRSSSVERLFERDRLADRAHASSAPLADGASRSPALGARRWALGRRQASGFRLQAPGRSTRALGVERRALGRRQASGFRLQASGRSAEGARRWALGVRAEGGFRLQAPGFRTIHQGARR